MLSPYRKLLFLFCCFLASRGEGADSPLKLQAAFIYQFTKYIEWQAIENSSAFEINVPDDLVLHQALASDLADKKIKELPIQVTSNFANLKSQIYVISNQNEQKSEALMRQLENCNCLIIGLNKDNLRATIRLIQEGDSFKFYISQDQAKRQNLYISARLLKLAKPEGS